MNNRDKPSSPCKITVTYMDKDSVQEFSGLSKRERIAAMCLQGLCGSKPAILIQHSDAEIMANRAIILADALLSQLEKQ